MRFSATLYALTIATSAIASPLHAARATDQDIVDEESTKVINGEPSEVIQILEPETDAGSTLTEELIVEINDPDYVSTKMLKERINTKGASNVAYGQAIAAAVDAAYTQAKQIKNWDKARQAFTQGMVGSMSARNPDFGKAKAAVCYNQGYRIRDPSNYYGLRSVSFSSGLLKTNYDCFYLGNNNEFNYAGGDGGFQNLAMSYPSSSCSWQRGVSLSCR